MIKLSKRLDTIASFCDKEDKVVDVGCDHGLLSIYLQDKVKSILATDINENALNSALDNFKKYKVDIKALVCDGIDNEEILNYDTLIMAGMGASTILHILSNKKYLKNIKKIIISTHTHPEIVREYLNNIGFSLEDEIAIYDKHYYLVMKFRKNNKKHSNDINKYGLIKSENISYYKWMVDKNQELLKKNLDIKTKKEVQEKVDYYQKVIEKIGE